MTANQISYATLVEAKRHNKELEEQGRQSVAAQQLSSRAQMSHAGAAYATVAESSRHNRQMEDIGWNQYYSLANLQSAQAAGVTKDSDTRRFSAESTDQHYQRSDVIDAFRSATGALTDTAQALARIYMVP